MYLTEICEKWMWSIMNGAEIWHMSNVSMWRLILSMLGSQNGTFLSFFPFIILHYSTLIHALLHPKPRKSDINYILMIVMGSLVLFSKIMYFKCFKVNLWLNIIKLTYIHYISNIGLRFVMCRNIWRNSNKND